MSSKYREPADVVGWWAWGIGGLIIIAFVIFLVFVVKSENTKISNQSGDQSYSGDIQYAPVAVLSEKYFNYGPLKNKYDLVRHSFTLSNTGKSDLIVSKLTTSCHCTTAQIAYDGKSSQKWGMASSSSWRVSIRSGESATIFIEYDPKKMINDGLIQRAIYIGTNDPNNPELTYEMDAENNL